MAALWPPPSSSSNKSLPTEPANKPVSNTDGTLAAQQTKSADGTSVTFDDDDDDDDDDDEDKEEEVKPQHVECHSLPDRCLTSRLQTLIIN